LSAKSEKVLRLIARGYNYDQIIKRNPKLTYQDIFRAAEEALRLNRPPGEYQDRMASIKSKHAKAYAPWTAEDDVELMEMNQAGKSVEELANYFQRQPSAICSRLAKLDPPEYWTASRMRS
jgi:hypothetical protein